MKRREFIRCTGHGALLTSLFHSMGISPFGNSMLQQLLDSLTDTDHVLVMIFLSGGNDGLNTVVPMEQMSVLHKLRPHVALPDQTLLPLRNTTLGLHPALDTLHQLFNEDRLTIVQNVGYPNQDFSHFRSSDIWLSASSADEIITTGWLGRALHQEYPNYPEGFPNDKAPDPLAVEMGFLSSLTFQGPTTNMAVSISNPDTFYEIIEDKEVDIPNTPAGKKIGYIRHVIHQSQQYGQRLKDLSRKAQNKVQYPTDNPLAQQLKIIARLIAAGSTSRIYLAYLDGFDTHDKQVDPSDHTQGEHATLLHHLDQAIGLFLKDLERNRVDQRVLGMTFSEFGRRIVSNASGGTDHGAAAPMFLFGTPVQGGIIGSNPTLHANMTAEDNLPPQFDFRQVYASVLEQWLCLNPSEIENVLFDNFQTLPICKPTNCQPTATRRAHQQAGNAQIQIHPNRTSDFIQISFLSYGQPLRLDLINAHGSHIHTLLAKTLPNGTHHLRYPVNHLPAGLYYIRWRSRQSVQSKAFVKL